MVTQLIPQERISDRVVEQTVYIPSPQIPQEEARLFSWNRVDQRQRFREPRAVHLDGTHVAGCTEKNAKFNDMRVVRSEVAEFCCCDCNLKEAWFILSESAFVQQHQTLGRVEMRPTLTTHSAQQIEDVPVPQIAEETMEAAHTIPLERSTSR